MKATMILGDYARVSDGKLDVLGGGWTLAGPGPITMGIGVMVEVPWESRTAPHHLSLRLCDADGRLVQLQQPDGTVNAIEIATDFQLETSGDVHPEGAPAPFALAVNVPNLPLPPASRFEWWLEIDGQANVGWRAAFTTRPLG